MKGYKRKQILSIVSLICGMSLLAVGFYTYPTAGSTILIIILALSGFCFYNFYYYIKPFILLDEEKLIINYDLHRKEYKLSDLKILNSSKKEVEFLETKSGKRNSVLLTLATLSDETRKEFLEDIHSKVKSV